MFADNDTIAAPATASGGALSVIRLSGPRAVECADAVFRGRRPLAECAPATLHYGRIADGRRTVDDVVVALFRAPHSYTGEDSVEISCHGSQYIVSEILRLLTAAGARLAAPGEFTARAFLAGRIDLSQAEAVADMIAADSRAAHAMASTQMRGAYSESLRSLRDRLLRLTSLLELELDFSEEDVAFADRAELGRTMQEIATEIDRLTGSFTLGNAIKEGVAVAIVGAPNAGKSTLLNRLLGEERAMVSDIAGTTRDTIEERMNIDGVTFRFIDTAGLRETDDRLETLGIERTREAVSRAAIVLSMTTPGRPAEPVELRDDQRLIPVINKIDLAGNSACDYNSVCDSTCGPTGDSADATTVQTSIAVPLAVTAAAQTVPQTVSQSAPQASATVSQAAPAGFGETSDGTFTADDTREILSCENSTAANNLSAANNLRPESAHSSETAARPIAAPSNDCTPPHDTESAIRISALTGEGIGELLSTNSLSAANNLRPESAHSSETAVRPIATPSNDCTTPHDTESAIRISALTGEGIDELLSALRSAVDTRALYAGDAIVSSARHREALAAADESLTRAREALAANLPADLLSEDIRSVIHHLGTITGEITSDDILRNIFSKFCIGK